jgi:hypothetical protein
MLRVNQLNGFNSRLLEVETISLLAAMTAQPDFARVFLINRMIKALKLNGIWDRLDLLYVKAAHNSQAARLNWVTPSSFTLTVVGSPVFTADRGYAGAASAYLNTGWDGATNAVKASANSISVFAWNRNNRSANTGCIIGSGGPSASDNSIYPRYPSTDVYLRANDNPASAPLTASTSDGFFHADRQSSTARTGYRNGSSLGSYGSVSSGALSNFDLYILALNYNNSQAGNATSDQVAVSGVGASINDKPSVLYSIIQEYLVGVGAA